MFSAALDPANRRKRSPARRVLPPRRATTSTAFDARRAHPAGWQWAAKNYRNDKFIVSSRSRARLRSRPTSRLAEVSANTIASHRASLRPRVRRPSTNRLVQVRPFYARGQMGQSADRRLPGADRSRPPSSEYARHEMVDSSSTRARRARHRPRHVRQALRPSSPTRSSATEGYAFSQLPMGQRDRYSWCARLTGNPCFTQIHPTCIPSTRGPAVEADLMSESCCTTAVVVWVPKR